MHIDMDVDSNSFKGSQELKYWNNSPHQLEKVYYHLYYNAFQPGSSMDIRSRTIADPDPRVGDRIYHLEKEEEGYHKILSLTQDGKKVDFQMDGTILVVKLNKPIAANSSSVFKMEFESQIPIQVRRTGRDNKEGIRYSMTQWYPKMAEYDYMGWHTDPYIGREFHSVWGDFDVKISIDSSYVIGGTGYLQNPEEIGHGYLQKGEKLNRPDSKKLTWHFKAPMVLDFAFAADPDFKHRKVKLNDLTDLHFFYQEDSNTTYWDSLPYYTVKIFQYMNENFGKYPYKQYSVIQGGDGGMEYPMATLITGNRSKGSLIGVTAHEAIHSWYQHLLASNESLYPWMDEGFTSYAADKVLSNIFPNFQPFEDSYESYFSLARSGKQEPLTTHADHYNTNWAYGVASYSMGLIFLHQLSYVVGQDVFMQGMRDYYDKWKFKHPNPNDFIRVLEKASDMELHWYLQQWTGTTNTIDYAINKVYEKNDSSIILLQKIGNMPMPLDIKIIYTDSSERFINIPLDIMRSEKAAEKDWTNYTVEADWPWTYPFYELRLPVNPAQIQSIEIDPSGRLADIDRSNNLYPQKRSFLDKIFRK